MKNIPRRRKKINYFEICISGVNWNFKILIGQPSLVERDDHPNKSTIFWNGGSTNFSCLRIFSAKHLKKKCISECLHKIKIPKTCPHWKEGSCEYDENDCWYLHAVLTCPFYFYNGVCKFGEQCNNSQVKKYAVTSLSQKAK